MGNPVGAILHGGPVDGSEIKRIRDILLFEGSDLSKRLVRFFCLLILASSIATFGLLGNSLAVVIGAMIVAPLMLPIMGLAFSVSIGDRPAILSSLLVSLGGIITAIAIGFILTMPMARLVHPESIDQIMIRTAPRLVDLLAALATGLAGAFALSRRDVSDTLPGVAIAVSLVPPLTNVGGAGEKQPGPGQPAPLHYQLLCHIADRFTGFRGDGFLAGYLHEAFCQSQAQSNSHCPGSNYFNHDPFVVNQLCPGC